MTTTTATLTEFVLARVADDEAVAESALHLTRERWWVDGPARESGKWWVYATGEKFNDRSVSEHIARHDPAQVLAECAAKKAIVALSTADTNDWGAEQATRLLASVYADHPAYDEAWLP